MIIKLLIDKGLKNTDFVRKVGIRQNTTANFQKKDYVSMGVLVKIYLGLDSTLRILSFI